MLSVYRLSENSVKRLARLKSNNTDLEMRESQASLMLLLSLELPCTAANVVAGRVPTSGALMMKKQPFAHQG